MISLAVLFSPLAYRSCMIANQDKDSFRPKICLHLVDFRQLLLGEVYRGPSIRGSNHSLRYIQNAPLVHQTDLGLDVHQRRNPKLASKTGFITTLILTKSTTEPFTSKSCDVPTASDNSLMFHCTATTPCWCLHLQSTQVLKPLTTTSSLSPPLSRRKSGYTTPYPRVYHRTHSRRDNPCLRPDTGVYQPGINLAWPPPSRGRRCNGGL